LTSRERLIAASRGGDVDQRPVICWPNACDDSDAIVDAQTSDDKIRLATPLNPFGLGLKIGAGVDQKLAEDPAAGEKVLDQLVDQTKQSIRASFDKGADGILYLLYGARGLHTSPMEYGGHFLERDREILAEIEDSTFNMIFVVGEDDAYLDFVSDLPAHAFAWDSQATGTSSKEMRAMREGALATNSPGADIELRFGADGLAAELELMLQESHA
jgi:uroporphyrinogen-III decarboxylase